MARIVLNPKLAVEVRNETFNFTSSLAASGTETISTASTTAIVFSGTDASPGAIISGTATISGAQVTQKIQGGIVGVIYELRCSITTSTGQTLVLAGYLAIVPDLP